MYQNLTTAWHNAIVDGQTPQELLLIPGPVPDTIGFSALCGDFVANSIEIMDEAQPEQDITIGNTASKTFSCSLVKRNGQLPTLNVNEITVMTGVCTSQSSVSFGTGVNQQLTVDGHIFQAKTNGFYKDGTKKTDGNFVSIVAETYSFGNSYDIIAYADDGTYYFEDGGGNTDTGTATDYHKEKYCEKSLAILWPSPVDDGGNVTNWVVTYDRYENGVHYQYTMIPMGIFEINGRIAKTDYSLTISDAYDRMSLLDIDVTDDVLTYATNHEWGEDALRDMLDEHLGLDIATHAGAYLDDCVRMTTDGFKSPSYTLREFASLVAEYCGCTAVFNREGKFDVVSVGADNATTYAIPNTRIKYGTYQQSEYSVKQVNGIKYYTIGGYPYQKPASATNRYISKTGNEFFTSGDIDDVYTLWLSRSLGFSSYKPMSATILEADPSFDSGDLISVMGAQTPLMTQTLKFTGKWSAEYESKGHETMPQESDGSSYNNKINGQLTPPQLLATCTAQSVTAYNLPSNMNINQFSYFIMVLTRMGDDVPYQVASEIIVPYNIDAQMGYAERNMHRVCYTNSSDASVGNVRAAGYCFIDEGQWKAYMSVTSNYNLQLFGAY